MIWTMPCSSKSSKITSLIYCVFLLYMVALYECEALKGEDSCSRLHLVERSEWRARKAVRQRRMYTPVNHVVILHTVTDPCPKPRQCARMVQFVQDFHLDQRGWWDIAYNFLVGGDGRVYVGRGWNNTGSFSINFNSNSIGVAFIGNFNNDFPSEAMTDAALDLIECGIYRGFLTPSVEVHGHRDVSCTESPGDHLYKIIQTWRNFKGGKIPQWHCSPPEDSKTRVQT